MITHIRQLITIIIFSLVSSLCFAESSTPYNDISSALKLIGLEKKIDGQIYAPIFLKETKEGLDLDKAKFRISTENGTEQNLKFELLRKIPINSLGFEDISLIEKGFTIKLWIPIDLKKYNNGFIKNDLKEGSFKAEIIRPVLNSETIEEARANYKERRDNKIKK